MFLFEKSLIGTYCNRLYNLNESHGPFSCYGRSKANTAGKNPNVTNINTKKGILLNHFVVALINVCTMKLAQLHQLISFKSARVIMCPARVESHHT